jgi:hypothetical protein
VNEQEEAADAVAYEMAALKLNTEASRDAVVASSVLARAQAQWYAARASSRSVLVLVGMALAISWSVWAWIKW